MVNWRKRIIIPLLRVSNRTILENLRSIKEIENDKDRIAEIHRDRLENLIRYCYENVPYYRDKLEEAKVVVEDEVRLENYDNLPVLTKEEVRDNFEDLKSEEIDDRDSYVNNTGGSTGKPLSFIQDSKYKTWNYADKLYYADMAGKEIGEPEIKLWGSQRDIKNDKRSLINRFRDYLYNRVLLNSFQMSEQDMRRYVKTWNSHKPTFVWAYVDSIYEFAKFIEREELTVHSPEAIATTAGTLNEELRTIIEEVFDTTVIDQYGSREAGTIAVECREKEGLHILEHTQHVEVVDEEGNPVAGEEGDILITNLANYSMPLLRYKIEDRGIMSENECSCDREFKTLDEVTGRKVNHFKNKEGELIHGEYFSHLFYGKNWVSKFRVVQESIDHISVEIEKRDECPEKDLEEIRDKIKEKMGENCKVQFNFQEQLEASESGKFLFTESKVLKD